MHAEDPAAAYTGFAELWESLQGKPRTATTCVRFADCEESLQCKPGQAAYVEELSEEARAL